MLKPVSRKNLIKQLRHFGFAGPYSGGRHQFMQRQKQRLMIPNFHGGDIGIVLLKRIINQIGITESEWNKI